MRQYAFLRVPQDNLRDVFSTDDEEPDASGRDLGDLPVLMIDLVTDELLV